MSDSNFENDELSDSELIRAAEEIENESLSDSQLLQLMEEAQLLPIMVSNILKTGVLLMIKLLLPFLKMLKIRKIN